VQHGSPLKGAISGASAARDPKGASAPHLEVFDFKLMASELTSLQATLAEDLHSIGDRAMVQLLSLGCCIMSVSAGSESQQLGPPATRAVLSKQVRAQTTRCKVLHLGMDLKTGRSADAQRNSVPDLTCRITARTRRVCRGT
jgi:hypothetical protein